jgi:hypothetical protein
MTCRLSVVTAARSDNHGGGFLRRFELFTGTLLELAARHKLAGELIVVDWNSPHGATPLERSLGGRPSPHFAVRFVRVSPELHSTIKNSNLIGFFQMIAKNVGIRRARGEWILATNCDVLFSDELVQFFASGNLDKTKTYRIDRTDVPAEAPADSLDTRLSWARANVMRCHGRWDSVITGQSNVFVIKLRRALLNLFLGIPVLRGRWGDRFRLHLNACGDFEMLDRDAWFAMHGYPELPLYSLNIDSILHYGAAALGKDEVILSYPNQLFHLEHANGWASMNARELYESFRKLPWLDMGLVHQLGSEMMRDKKPIVFNGDDWGFGGHDLPDEWIPETPT